MWHKQPMIIFIFFGIIKVLHATCGQPKIPPRSDIHFKITGGIKAIPFSWPWMVYLKIFYSPTKYISCGGTLINKRWVLTVAHCFYYRHFVQFDVTVKFGVFDKTKCPRRSTHHHIDKHQFNSSIFIHPDYVPGTHAGTNDIALIKLPRFVKYNKHISPVCLPRYDTKINVIGKHLTITGWGKTNETTRTNKLRQAVVSIQPADVPNVFGCYYIRKFDKNKQICAGLPAYDGHPRKGDCAGDSGGPLVWFNETRNKWFEYAIISGGHRPCGGDNEQAVFIIVICTIKYLNTNDCGHPTIPPHPRTHFKITGGTDATPFSWPWQVYIILHSTKYIVEFSGTLINSRWVLTAAHTFFYGRFQNMTLKLGIFDKTNCPRDSLHYHVYEEELHSTVFTHPGYVHKGDLNDIALIKLSEYVEYSDHISPVCLPRNDATVNVIGTRVAITGWGQVNGTKIKPKKLQQAVIDIQPAHLPSGFGCHYKKFDTQRQICAGIRKNASYTPRKGTCRGDSGGPLVWKNTSNNKWFQYGIVSAGPPCGNDTNEADHYTRVTYYCDWIEQVIGQSICLP